MDKSPKYRRIVVIALAVLSVCILFWCCMLTGASDIPVQSVLTALTGGDDASATQRFIVIESRLPFALTAMLAGAALSVAGLMLQTVFQNPLAGPSVLGVSSGSSLGVAFLTLGAGHIMKTLFNDVAAEYATTIAGAALGAGLIIAILVSLSSFLRSSMMLLIAGMMISYLASSVISLLNFFAPAEDVKTFALWGMGSFSGVSFSQLPFFGTVTVMLLLVAILCSKPLNALLLGERYAVNMGYSMRRTRSLLLIVSGALTAFITAFCGPVAFIGLTVPHISRILTGTSNHNVLLPATVFIGSAVAMFCAWLSLLPSSTGVIPVNAVTPCIGVPVILYIILRRRKLAYFN